MHLGGLDHSSAIAHSKWWLVVLILPIQPWHQRFLKAQFLALYCFCYTLTILILLHKLYQHSQLYILVTSICKWLFSLPTYNYKFSCWPLNPPEWFRRLNDAPGLGHVNGIIRSFKCLFIILNASSPTRCVVFLL